MSPQLLQTSAIVVSLGLLTSACENLSPGENAGLFGAAAGLATGIPLAAAGVDPAITIPVTAGAVAVAGVSAYVIAKHQASERQRKIAEQRARVYLAEQAQKQKEQEAAAAAAKAKQKKPRYIAVQTVKEDTNQGKSQVMIFDTQSNELVGNNVYDLKSSPKVGQTTKFDTYSAEYVGTGS
ncbi:hypothetical protein DB345_11495 [Spartobacteria bacterium LR76]|nr:hypothetical protein DB345_11495 [Spartobacteria bacterium LR76]